MARGINAMTHSIHHRIKSNTYINNPYNQNHLQKIRWFFFTFFNHVSTLNTRVPFVKEGISPRCWQKSRAIIHQSQLTCLQQCISPQPQHDLCIMLWLSELCGCRMHLPRWKVDSARSKQPTKWKIIMHNHIIFEWCTLIEMQKEKVWFNFYCRPRGLFIICMAVAVWCVWHGVALDACAWKSVPPLTVAACRLGFPIGFFFRL